MDEQVIVPVPDEYLKFWYAISKRDDGHKKFHIPSVIFYFLDLTVFIINIITHVSNRAYFGVGLTILIHFISAWIISAFYKKNETSIDESNVVFNAEEPEVWKWRLFRRVCQVLAITPLFRIIANWRDHRERHEFAREQRVLRRSITIDEVEAIVLNKKRQCVKSYFDSLHAYFKTVPQCLLQVYIAVEINLPLRFCNFTDLTRMITLAWTMIAASKASASLGFALNDYLKGVEFQDFLVHGNAINLNPPKRHTYWISLLWNMISIGARIYAISYIISFGGKWLFSLIVLVFIFNLVWMSFSTTSRPSYENPPSGFVSFFSELVDRYINIFCFHMIRLNLKTVLMYQLLFIICFGLVLGTAIFQIFDFNNFELVHVIDIVDHAYHEIHSKCNFTIFSDSVNGFARILHEILNSHDEDVNRRSNFKDLFSNEIVLVTSMLLSTFTSILYVTIYTTWAKLENVEFPLQNSIREWKIFLNQNWQEVGPELGLKLLIFGVADSIILEFWKYKLPNNVLELKQMLYECVNHEDYIDQVPKQVNDVILNELLNSLSQYLRDLNLLDDDESQRVMNYFVNYFPACMKQMTSYRIAQIFNAIAKHEKLANANDKGHFCGRVFSILPCLPFCNRKS